MSWSCRRLNSKYVWLAGHQQLALSTSRSFGVVAALLRFCTICFIRACTHPVNCCRTAQLFLIVGSSCPCVLCINNNTRATWMERYDSYIHEVSGKLLDTLLTLMCGFVGSTVRSGTGQAMTCTRYRPPDGDDRSASWWRLEFTSASASTLHMFCLFDMYLDS